VKSHLDELDQDEVEQIQSHILSKSKNILDIFESLQETLQNLKGTFIFWQDSTQAWPT
jgi:hypothetical protein